MGLGISPSRELAKIEAQAMSKIPPYEIRDDIGNISRILDYLNTAVALKNSIKKWFKFENETQRFEAFQAIRKNRSDDPKAWAREYLGLLTTKNSQDPVKTHDQLQSYFRYLSVIKDLPQEVSNSLQASASRDQFGTISSPGIMVYADIKGLGARNLMDLDANLNKMQQSLSELKSYVLSQQDGDINPIILKSKYEVFTSVQKQMLSSSIDFASTLQSTLSQRIIEYSLKFGVKPVIWVGGDDIFILIPNSAMNHNSLGRFLKFENDFGFDIRVAISRVDPSLGSVTLKDVRNRFGDAVDVMKAHEMMWDHDHFAVVDFISDKTKLISKDDAVEASPNIIKEIQSLVQ